LSLRLGSVLRSAAAVFVAVVLSLAALELGARLLVSVGLLKTPVPVGFDDSYWEGDRPDFGVWRKPNAEFHHQTSCFDVTYRTNAVGARDVERAREAREPRVIVLGDSFSEGWGVEQAERFSDRLESATGVPHLNFAMAHFSPYQAYLVYRDLAKHYDHDGVLFGVLPLNDFADLDAEWAQGHQQDYLYRYRPYLVPDGDGWQRLDLREPPVLRFLRRGSYAWNAVLPAWQRLRSTSAAAAAEDPALEGGAHAIKSFFYDADDRQMRLLEEVLSRMAEEAKGKKVAVVLIPGLRDLRRHAFSGPDPLSPRLEAFGAAHGLRVVSLLEPMAKSTPNWSEYYLGCDYHFSPLGHAVAARILQQELVGFLYPAASPQP
jgi:hypothetical protein